MCPRGSEVKRTYTSPTRKRGRNRVGQLPRLRVGLVSLLLAAPLLAQGPAQLDRYLQRLGLTDLRLVHHEEQLAVARDEATKTARAKQLSDLYAQRLLEAAD